MPGGLDFSARVARVRRVLVFGDAACRLVAGSSREGWDCPCCCGPLTVKERLDRKGARCRACGAGFDVLKLVRRKLGKTATEALAFLEEQADASEEKAAKAGQAPDLFGGGV